ncbi:unnamed protein product [Schistosoma margrebowiei]|uniref:Uncharacterized protein n=1 Tax=Schistosoma margrebowiei TaxID=48269 RepID=A0A183MCP2_9TREM|nr:unnamed protein product [Schistosoma margrebowiei]
MLFNCRNASLTLSILELTSASNPPRSSIILFRYVKFSTCSRVSPSSVVGLVFFVLYLRILLFPLCMLRPSAKEGGATLFVFIAVY